MRRKPSTLWNVSDSFFVTYARLTGSIHPRAMSKELSGRARIPRRIDLYKTVQEVTLGLEEYDVASSVLGWPRRFWTRSPPGTSVAPGVASGNRARTRTGASPTGLFHHVLVTLTEILAPFIPFMTEEIYRNS